MGFLQLLKNLTKYLKTKSLLTKLSTKLKLFLLLATAVLIKYAFHIRSVKKPLQNIITMPISQFLHPLNKYLLDTVKIYPNTIHAVDRFNNLIRTSHGGMPSNVLYNQLKDSAASNLMYMGQSVGNSGSSSIFDYLFLLASFSSAILIYFLVRKKGEEKKSSKPVQKVMFDDIVGLDSAKLALKEVLDFMMEPEKYQNRGARMRRGVLLYGPPGTGKTTLAKACANEAGVPFYSCNAAQFCQIYVGMGPKKVRQLFSTARQNSPSVIFIDELDALGSRSGQNGYLFQSAHSEKNSTINQILSQIDGFQTNDKVLVIAATNRLEMVDKSLVRSGRFDIKINIKLPPLEMKVKIFHKYLDKTKNNLSQQYIRKLLEKYENCSGADIQALINQAIYLSIRRGSSVVQEQDIANSFKYQAN